MDKNHLRDFLGSEGAGVTIPIIQRDYVQGNDANANKRDPFLEDILAKLKSGETMNLDFMYGRTAPGEGFIPIDGQQRLTTLFLILWALDTQCGKGALRSELKKFTYKTRISSHRFGELLVDMDNRLPCTPGIRETLQRNTRYDAAWDCDPTVVSMLDMLEAIAERIKNEKAENIQTMYENLKAGKIQFDALNMRSDDFTLTDDLYIKMNARGKQLTDFENLKAKLIGVVEKNYPDQKEDFCRKLEYDWTQLFWNSAYENWAQLSEEEKKIKPYPIVDHFFLNTLDIITELLFFQNASDNTPADAFKGSIAQYEAIYKDPTNFAFLIGALDHLYAIAQGDKQQMAAYFDAIFYWDENALIGPANKVRLFSGNTTNLFDAAIHNGRALDVKLKIIFFAYLYYSVNCPTGNRYDFLRLVRNYLEGIQFRKEVWYTSDVRINQCKTYWTIIKSLAVDDPLAQLANISAGKNEFIQHEQTKTTIPHQYKEALDRLESFKYFRGKINANLLSAPSQLPAFVSALEEIWSQESALISRALIACGFRGLYIKNCALGQTWTFGYTDNWDRILLDTKDNWLSILLQKYIERPEPTPAEKLEALIEERIQEIQKHQEAAQEPTDWVFCFLKYPELLAKHTYYVRPEHNKYMMEGIDKISSHPLVSFHVNPYVKYVCEHIPMPHKPKVPWVKYAEWTGNFTVCGVVFTLTEQGWRVSADQAAFTVCGVVFTLTEQGWRVSADRATSTPVIPEDWLHKYHLHSQDNAYYLLPAPGQDIISVALDFIRDLTTPAPTI